MDDEQVRNLKMLVKKEKSDRLNSLRLPRDLTLGGPTSRQVKKQFVPNLKVVRNKEKTQEAVLKRAQGPKLKDSERRELERRRNTSRFVQSAGVFSEGVGADVRRSSRWSDRRSDKENEGTSSAMTMPTLKKKDFVIDAKAESDVFSDLLGEDDQDSENDEKVPFQFINWCNVISEVKNKSKIGKTEVKQELTSLEYLDENSFNDNKLFCSLWKMPDTLGKNFTDDPHSEQVLDYHLKDMPEGQIGKMIVRQSGKMEVQIGNMTYELEKSILELYKEDLVSLDPDNQRGSISAVLETIENRYHLIPDWNSLLK